MPFWIVVLFAVLMWIFIYTVSFGMWTWRRKNKLGAIMVFLLACSSIALPVYTLLFRE